MGTCSEACLTFHSDTIMVLIPEVQPFDYQAGPRDARPGESVGDYVLADGP